MKKDGAKTGKRRMPARQVRDVNNRNILKDPLLCAQFLREYVDKELFKELRPEDIEDESEKYQAYLGITFETDTVKRIRMHLPEQETPLYLISLIDHKSQVDYNVSIQLLRYMVCIWNEYGKEMEGKRGQARNKSFRYPPVLPIVYYEGKEPWTADMHLRDRILMNDLFKAYIPDFTYKVVRCHDYTNGELLEKGDEMSLLMLLGKAQTPEDMHGLVAMNPEKVECVVKKAPDHIVELFASTVWNLCMKMNVPQNEASQYVRKVREREMGYWFENMEKMDIQLERRNTAQARAELKQAREELERAKTEARQAEAREAQMQAKAAEAAESLMKSLVDVCQSLGASREQTVVQLMEKCRLDRETAESKIAVYLEDKG